MKNIILKYSLLFLAVTLFVSCEDELDQVPFDTFGTENAFSSSSDFENAIRGAYSALTRDGLYGVANSGGMSGTPDILTDNVTLSQFGRFTQETMHEFDYNAASTASALYTDGYQLIYRTNQILEFAEGFSGNNKANIIAEAKALRAFAHFNMVSMFGKIPTQSADANSSLGVAYITNTDVTIDASRNTVGEVYGFIVQDLLDARENITNTEGSRFNVDAVNVLLSRVYLYMGQWQNSIDAANQVSASIASRDNFVGIWDDSNNDGLLFSIENDQGVLGNSIGVTWSQGGLSNIIPEYVVSYEFFNKFSDDDIRKEAYIASAFADGTPVNAIIKQLGRDGNFNGQVDYKLFRASEAALNKAEAYYNLGEETLALNALNELRVNRYTSPSNGESGTALRDVIRLERRLEFAFEYQRFLDLKRYGLGVERTNDGDHADGGGTASGTLTLPAGSPRLQLPIPQSAIDRNSNMVQNPGY